MTEPAPELPALSRELGSPAFSLQRSAPPDDDRAFTLTGARIRVAGGMARGVDEARSESLHLLSRLRLEGSTPAGTVLTPIGLERQLDMGDARLVERVAAAPSAPVCFFEWATEPSGPATLTLTWILHGAQARSVDRGVVVDSDEGRRIYVFSRTPAELTVRPAATPERGPAEDPPGDRLLVRARLDLAAGASVRLAIAGIGPADDEARVLRVLGRSQVVVPTRRAEAQRILSEGLAVQGPEDSLGEALAWAKTGLAVRGAPDPHGSGGPSQRGLRLALAALACGERAPARTLLGGPAEGHPRHLLLVARYLAWTGDLATVKEGWDAVRAAAEAVLGDAAAGGVDGLRDGALRELVVVAEEVGDPHLADRLKAVVGERESPVEVLLDRGDPLSDEALGWATVVESVVRGLLGAEPDAPRGRLVLRPRLPASWDRFEVRGLTIGEAAVEMAYARTAGVHRFTLRQSRGGAPIRVILEPELQGAAVVGARVDGAPAELDPRPVDGRLQVPVQVVLDHERRVEVEIRGAGA